MVELRNGPDKLSTLVKRDGALCLTFVNTAADRRQPLEDYAGLVAWGRRHGALSAAEAGHLEGLATGLPEDAAEAFGAAEELRALLSRLFNALADDAKPPREAAESLNGYLLHSVPPRRLVLTEGLFSLDWAAGREDDLGRPLWPVVLSATAVLTSEDRERVVRCAGPDCGVLFVARNSGWPRKWCQRSCGRRVTSLRHYYDKVKPYKADVRRVAEERVRRNPDRRKLDG